jgi:phosphatidylserine/phosphatidylglycerophosphate/cardiolipin synthase-like enzyme
MRNKDSQNGLSALATAGSYVVLLGWDMAEAAIKTRNVLGFAIQRTRQTDGEVIWLSGMKTFESVEPHPAPGVLVSSFTHPFQTFQWADYSVSPGVGYAYRIVAMRGPAQALQPGPEVTLQVTTERVDQGKHAVFFNRGAIASQEYARRFHDAKPSEIGQAAYDWLSRGLLEGLERFIAQAKAGDELHGAFFEFKNRRVYAALKAAKHRGASIKILYDGDSQRESNEEHLADSGIKSLTKARTRSGNYAHNKFLVWREGGVSKEVWTGSTNLSDNGIFGHSNNAHIVRDPGIAEQYEQYWQILFKDQTRKPTAKAAETISSAPPAQWTDETSAVFSPRLSLDALDWYAGLAAGSKRGLFATFAFGMNERFVSAYDRPDDVLRFALMEKKGNGSQYAKQAAEIDRIRRHPNVTISVGNHIAINAFDRWLKEIESPVEDHHVTYIHTKYMLIDPLGDEPIVIVGSANFSVASTDTNDENMLVIRGNKEVADIYLGEFMRLFSHYAFRESLTFPGAMSENKASARKYLRESVDWVAGADGPRSGYFVPGSDRALRRAYFSGW